MEAESLKILEKSLDFINYPEQTKDIWRLEFCASDCGEKTVLPIPAEVRGLPGPLFLTLARCVEKSKLTRQKLRMIPPKVSCLIGVNLE